VRQILPAGNLSDIHFIDPAKKMGGLIGPKTSVNYVLALFLGVFPLLFVFIFYINNSIQNTGDIKLTQIPLIGVVGLNKEISELAVLTDSSRLCQSLQSYSLFPSVFV
jgi:capsular polysaccharide biosynthesis protein